MIHVCLDEKREIAFDLELMEEDQVLDDGHHYVYEPDVTNAVLRFVRPGDICIDAGANRGYHSLLMSRLVGPKGEVIAFEPDPAHFKRLLRNVELNKAYNILSLNTALWSEQVEMDFWTVEGGGYSSFLHYSDMPDTSVHVLTESLDRIISEDVHVRLLKIDCEGAEEHILRGAERLLRRGVDFVIAEMNFHVMPAFNSTDRSIRDYMDGLGYDFFFLYRDGSAPGFVAHEMRIEVKSGTGKTPVFNTLFCPKGKLDELAPPGPGYSWKMAWVV